MLDLLFLPGVARDKPKLRAYLFALSLERLKSERIRDANALYLPARTIYSAKAESLSSIGLGLLQYELGYWLRCGLGLVAIYSYSVVAIKREFLCSDSHNILRQHYTLYSIQYNYTL